VWRNTGSIIKELPVWFNYFQKSFSYHQSKFLSEVLPNKTRIRQYEACRYVWFVHVAIILVIMFIGAEMYSQSWKKLHQ